MARGLAEISDGSSKLLVPTGRCTTAPCAGASHRTVRTAWRTIVRVATVLVATATLLAGAGTASAAARPRPGTLAGTSARALLTAKPKRPHKRTPPTISGAAVDGQVLTGHNGEWGGAEPISYSYEWEGCTERFCTPIPGATATTFRVESADIGHFLRFVVTATNAADHPVHAHAKNTKRVVEGPPVSKAPPAISGTPIVGQILEAGTGEWYGTPPFTYSYQWFSCSPPGGCLEISGATSATYTMQPLEAGDSLEVRVTASNKAGSASATSEETGLISDLLPQNTVLPSVGGSPIDGELLNALAGS